MSDPAKLTDEELEAELANLWMVITEYTRRYGELTTEQDRRERQGSGARGAREKNLTFSRKGYGCSHVSGL
jgi:hypothetical protein